MADRILEAFLARQQKDASALADKSDLLRLVPIGSPADRYLVEFRCKGLVERAPGEVVEANRFQVQVFDIITWNKVTLREDDALNTAACQWARRHPDRFPVDRRLLKRRRLALHAKDVSKRSQSHGETE